jgi:hypothetical protein
MPQRGKPIGLRRLRAVALKFAGWHMAILLIRTLSGQVRFRRIKRRAKRIRVFASFFKKKFFLERKNQRTFIYSRIH